MDDTIVLDLRNMPLRDRHPRIFKAWESVPEGGALRLVNDHDPKPLYYEFQAERPGESAWKYLEQGPEKWAVEIRRAAPPRSGGPIRASQTVQETIERHPETRSVFAKYDVDSCCGGAHPIQTAAMARGLDLAVLMKELNEAVSKKGQPEWVSGAGMREVDVREDLRNGREPFQKIMAAALETPEGGAFVLRAIFEPKPLYQVLGSKGFEHWAESDGPEDWKVYFRKTGPAGTAPSPSSAGSGGKGEVHKLDVRGLEPPEPMVRILSKLATMGRNDTLEVTHFREPVHLYPHLKESGYDYSLERKEEALYRITITKKK